MKLKVDFETQYHTVMDGYDFELENETYKHISELEESMDDNGRYVTHIYQRESDEKYFSIELFWIRYGYEDYSFKGDYNDGVLREVEKQEVTVVKWVAK